MKPIRAKRLGPERSNPNIYTGTTDRWPSRVLGCILSGTRDEEGRPNICRRGRGNDVWSTSGKPLRYSTVYILCTESIFDTSRHLFSMLVLVRSSLPFPDRQVGDECTPGDSVPCDTYSMVQPRDLHTFLWRSTLLLSPSLVLIQQQYQHIDLLRMYTFWPIFVDGIWMKNKHCAER
jgi:hypothetical protein